MKSLIIDFEDPIFLGKSRSNTPPISSLMFRYV